jgi:hypothetical protein
MRFLIAFVWELTPDEKPELFCLPGGSFRFSDSNFENQATKKSIKQFEKSLFFEDDFEKKCKKV